MAAQKRKEEAEAFKLATHQAIICAPASPTKSSPQHILSSESNDSNNDTNCHFMRLSPEVRGRIYHYAMDKDFHASLDPISSRYSDTVIARAKTPALMRTCSQMRAEAGAIWYSQTVFIYKLDAILYKWLQLIGPAKQKLICTVRMDSVLSSERWAEAYIAFTHSRLRDQKLYLAEDAIEVAFWQPTDSTAAKVETKEAGSNAALVAAATAALEHIVDEDDEIAEADGMLMADEGFAETEFEFHPDLELGDFAETFLDNLQSDAVTTMTGSDSLADDCSSNIGSKRSTISVVTSVKSSKGEDGDKKKKTKRPAKSSTSSVAGSAVSTMDSEKKEKAEQAKAEKKKNSPSSLAESVMSSKSTKSGKGDKDKAAIKKPAKPKVKKEPEPEKTWAFLRMEAITV